MLRYIHLAIAIAIVVPVLLVSMITAIIPAGILRLFHRHKAADSWMQYNGTLISSIIMWSLNSTITVKGLEKIPRNGEPLCFVANHQSALDIPAVVAGLRIWAGFIAKKELKRIPIVNIWISSIHSVYIDRKSPRSSIEAILQGIENIKNGVPMFIFPEGTRSKTGILGEFKPGSLKLATRARATIVPITIIGTRNALEAKQGCKRVPISLVVSDPISTKHLDDEGIKELPRTVYSAVSTHMKALETDRE